MPWIFSVLDDVGMPPEITRTYRRHGRLVQDFSFESEPKWRLKGILSRAGGAETSSVTTVELRSPDDSGPRWSTDLLEQFPISGQLAIIDVRGVSDTSWNPASSWHLRRAAAALGRSIASMQICDTLSAVEAVSQLTDRGRFGCGRRGPVRSRPLCRSHGLSK